jgi:hypothetical protein
MTRFSALLGAFVSLAAGSSAAEPCVSGLDPGQKPGPYTFVISTGPQRGQLYCYICETADRPAIVIFARSLSEPLGKLANRIDRVVTENKAADMRAWITFLHDDQPGFDAKVLDWSKKHAVRNVPLGIFEDAGGPPAYRLSRDADATVVLFVKQKVVANFAFRANELTEEKILDVLKAVPRLLEKK